MSDALFHRTPGGTSRPGATESFSLPRRSLPRGYGLLVGAAVSAGLWGAMLWLVMRVMG
jgi:hypothetical protein